MASPTNPPVPTSPARSPAWARRAPASTSTARAVSPGCFFFAGFRAGALRFLAGCRGRVRVATVATTVTGATPAPPHLVLGMGNDVPGRFPSPERCGGLDLHDHWDDHRAALGALVDEAAGGLADVAAEGLEVGGAFGGRLLEALEHRLAGLFQQ